MIEVDLEKYYTDNKSADDDLGVIAILSEGGNIEVSSTSNTF